MLTLYQFPRRDPLPSFSPFCMKLESYIRARQWEYDNVFTMAPKDSPTGKLPYIKENGHFDSDSGLLVKRWEQQSDNGLNEQLDTTVQARATALVRMLEEHLYWCIVYSRWQDPHGLEYWQETLRGEVAAPRFAFNLMFKAVRRRVLKALYGQGLGRFAPDTLYDLGAEDISAAAALLGDQPYCSGTDTPAVVDHCLYSFVGSVLYMPNRNAMQEALLASHNLLAHYNRMLRRFFPEFTPWQAEHADG